MPTSHTDLDQWRDQALAAPGGEELVLSVPLHVLFGEAVDVAKFFDKYWKTEASSGQITRRGLEMVTGGKKRGRELTAKTGEEILSLQRAAVDATARHRLVVDPKTTSPFERGRYLLDEIMKTLEFLLDDGVEDEKDAQLAQLERAHADDPQTADALALALDDYTALAAPLRDEMDGLGGFNAAVLDEAKQIAAALRERPTDATSMSSEVRQALLLRNKVIGLLQERIALVRAAAKFVFRDQPDIIREATSAYERKRRAEAARRAKKNKDQAQPTPR